MKILNHDIQSKMGNMIKECFVCNKLEQFNSITEIYHSIRRCEKCDEGVLAPNIDGPSHHSFSPPILVYKPFMGEGQMT